MPPPLALTPGQRFGRLTVVGASDRRYGRRMLYRCRCDCGNETHVSSGDLKYGRIVSCGCYHAEQLRARSTTHGMRGTREYGVWRAMKRRCGNPNDPQYPHYGGRGIRVCGRWLESFENFYADMGRRPSPRHWIDRIDVNGNFEPGNVRWATPRRR